MIEMEKLEKVKRRFEEVESLMADPEVATDPSRMQELGQEHSRLEEVADQLSLAGIPVSRSRRPSALDDGAVQLGSIARSTER